MLRILLRISAIFILTTLFSYTGARAQAVQPYILLRPTLCDGVPTTSGSFQAKIVNSGGSSNYGDPSFTTHWYLQKNGTVLQSGDFFGQATSLNFSGLSISPGDDIRLYASGTGINTAPLNFDYVPINLVYTPSKPTVTLPAMPLCNGASGVLTANGAGGTYTWSTGATGTSISVASPGGYTVTETNYCGTSPASDPATVTTSVTPAAPTVTPSGNQLLCNGASATLSSTGVSITWSNGATGNTLVTASTGTYYTYDHNSCGNSTSSNSVSVATVVCPTPLPGSSFLVCPGALRTLDAGTGYDTYLWSGGQTTRTVSVGPGTYTVTVTKSGCSATSAAVTVGYYAVASPTITPSGPTTFCAGGSVTLSSSAGAAYVWSNGSTSSSIVASTSGGYYVTITDGNGCQATSAATNLTVNPLSSATIAGSVSVCQNSAAQAIVFNGSGGTAPYTFTYKINGGATQTITTTGGNSISVIVPTTAPGTFVYSLISVQESSSTTCSNAANGTATVVVSPLPSAVISGSTTVCQNSTAPSVTFTGSGATAPYTFTYKINGGANQTVITTSGSSVTVAVPTATPGTFTYSLVSVQESSSTTCSNAASGAATVIVNPLPSAVISGSTTVCQNSASPAITFTGSGATAPYTFIYKINGGSNQTVTTTSGSSVTVAVPTTTPGTFTYSLVSVQESSSTSCSNAANGTATVVVSPLPSAVISGNTTVCQNSTAPSITFTGSGGTAPYTFTYKINGGSSQTVSTTSGSSVTVIVPTTASGTYAYSLVSVQESSGTTCSNAASGTATVVVNPLPSAVISGNTAVCQNSASPNITFTGSGATAPYTFTYKINGGANQTVSTTSGSSVTVAVPTTTPGTFTYTLVNVQESSSTTCSNAVSGTATVVVSPLPSAVIAGSSAVCQNSSAPTITFTGSGATAPYTFTYKINGGANQTVTTTSGNSVTVSVPTATPGTFTYSLVSVQESSGTTCTNAASGTAAIVVNALPSAVISGNTAVCQNSSSPSVTFTGSGGTAPYTFTYKVNGGVNQTTTTTSGNSVTVNVPTTTPGTYAYTLVSVQESSSTSCSNVAGGTASVVVNPLPSAAIAGSTFVCQNSAAPAVTFTGSGGTAPYTFTYKINGGANQTVTTTSGNSVTVAVPTATPGIFTYSLVSVQESSGVTCSNAASGTATVVVNPLPSAVISGNTTVCQNSPATLISFTGSGGTAPYTFTYKINGGANQTVSTISGNSITVAAPTATPGTFTYSLVSVQESSGTTCSNAASGSTTIVVNPLPSATIAGSTTICQSSTAPLITFTGSGGTAPYTFTYKVNGGTNQTVTTTSGSSVTVSVPTTAAGTYTYSLVSVQESSGTSCNNAASGTVTVVINPLPTATIAGSTTVCQNSAAPSITFTGSEATAPYTFTYRINGGSTQTVTTTSGSSVIVSVPTATPGTFTYSLVSVQESTGTTCSNATNGTATVVVSPLPSATIAGSATLCQNSAAPTITFTGSGATAPYTFTYKINGGSNQTISSTSGNSVTLAVSTATPGTFTYSLVSVQESSGTTCSNAASGTAIIIVNPLPSAVISGNTAVCQNSSSPLITFTGNGGMAPYTFTYKINGAANQTVTTTSGNSVTVSAPTTTPGTFTYSLVSVQDNSSTACTNTASGSAMVTVNSQPAAAVIAAPVSHLCNGEAGQLTIMNFMSGYSYAWYKDGGFLKTTSADTIMNDKGGSFWAVPVSDKGCAAASASNTIIILTGTITRPVITGWLHVCPGGKTRLSVVPTDTSKQFEVYKWTDTPIGDIVSRDSLFSASAGQYQLWVKREGCHDSALVTVSADDTDFPAGRLVISPSHLAYGARTTLTAEVTGAVQYEWNLGDGNRVSTSANTIMENYYSPGDSVRISVNAVSERNCKTEFTGFIKVDPLVMDSIKNHSWTGNLKDWNVFPTPFRGSVKVSVILQRNESVRIDLFTAEGRWVRSWLLKGTKGENLFNLDSLETLPAGVVYLITGVYNGEKHFDKIFKY